MELAFLKLQFWGRIIFDYICDWWMKLNLICKYLPSKFQNGCINLWIYYVYAIL